MKAERIKRLFTFFLILSLFLNIAGVANSKLTTADRIMTESLGNSINNAEFPPDNEIIPNESIQDKKNKEITIQGGVAKGIDVTLSTCIKIALGNNPRIKAAMSDVLASHTRIAQAWANYFPQITWQTSAAKIRQLELEDALSEILVYNYYLLGQIGLYQMLYDFGVTQNQVTIKKLSYEEYKTSLTGIINDVIYKTKDAYYNLLFAYDQQKLAEDNVERCKKFYNQARAFFEVGLATSLDATIAEVNLSSAKMELIRAENNIDLAMAKLSKEMGAPYFAKYNVKERLKYNYIPLTMDDSIELAEKSRPEYKLANLKVEEANQVVKLARKCYMPTLSIQANFARGGGSWNKNYGYLYGVYLNFPTINVLLNQNQIKEAKNLYEREIAYAQETKNGVYLEIQTAYLQLDEKRQQIPVSLLQTRRAGVSYEATFGKYKAGLATPVEVKDAQVTYQESLLNYYRTLYEYNSAKALLEKAIGRNLSVDDEG